MRTSTTGTDQMLDADAFVVFYEDHHASVSRAVTATLGDRRLASEAVDEAFTRAAERWEQVAAMERPTGWVYRVAVNWATSWRRKLALRPTLPDHALEQSHDDEHGLVLLDHLAALPLDRRQLLVLRHVLGYSLEETADVLGLPAGTVKSRSARALQQLRATMEVAHDAR